MRRRSFHRDYDRIYEQLTRVELQRGLSGLDELVADESLFDESHDRWLGFYTAEGLEYALDQYGVFADFRKRGFEGLRVELKLDDPHEQMLRIWCEEPRCDDPLVELVVSRDVLSVDAPMAEHIGRSHLPVLTVQWLEMQNPKAKFHASRLPLPGQRRPGLGMGAKILELLHKVCTRIGMCGMVTVPAYFHNAVMYSGRFRFLDADSQGTLEALMDALDVETPRDVAVASWAIRWNMVVDRSADPPEPFEWFHEAMFSPATDEFDAFFASAGYVGECAQRRASHRFELFEQPLYETLEARGLVPWRWHKVKRWLDDNV